MKQMRQKTIANMGDSHTLLEELLQRERSANDHDDDRHDQRRHVQAHDGGAGSVAEEHDVHDGGEDEGREHIREVADQRQDIREGRDQTRHQTHQHNLHRAEDQVLPRGDEDLAMLHIITLDRLVDGLHPQREAAHDGEPHHQVQQPAQRKAIRQRCDDALLHALLCDQGMERRLPLFL